MENQDKNLQKPHPKPFDDAQALVETIVPSTETEESTTTEVKSLQRSEKPVEPKKEEATSEKENDEVISESDQVTETETDETDAEEKNDKPDEGDKIETVAP